MIMEAIAAQVLDLLYRRGLTQAEVALEMGMSEPRVSQVNGRAMETMRAQIEGDERTLRAARLAYSLSERRAKTRPSGFYPSASATADKELDVTSTLPEEGIDLKAEMQRYQDWMVQQALIRSAGNKAKAAKLLKIERTTLVEMMRRSGVLRPLAKCKELPPEEVP